MSDWFKFHNDALDDPKFQFAISEQPLVTSVWLLILSEASKKRSSEIDWKDQDFELLGFARKINVSPPIFNQCLSILERIGYIKRTGSVMQVPIYEKVQSDYSKGLSKGYYRDSRKTLASDSEVSTARGEERRLEKSTPRAGGGSSGNGVSASMQAVLYREELTRVEAAVKRIEDSVDSHRDLPEADKARRRELKDKAEALKKKLNFSA